MSRKNHNAFLKKQRAERKRKAKLEKKQKMEARKNQPSSGKLEDMMAYLDEDGNIISKSEDPESPPEEEGTDDAPKTK